MASTDTRPPFLESPALSGFTMHWRHGFFGREGGVSTGVYKSLNTGPGSDDQGNRVKANRDRICITLGALPGRMSTLRQAHTNKAVIIDSPISVPQAPEADAIVTSTPDIVIAALAADCAPVLMGDPHACVIAAVHAGWRGALTGVMEDAIEKMISLGASPQNIIAAVGPCISQESFEVGPEFQEQFAETSPWSTNLFVPGKGDRLQFDLKQYCLGRLVRAGIGKSEALADDTVTQPEKFFSYRRSQAKKQKDYGRNASAIMLVG